LSGVTEVRACFFEQEAERGYLKS